MNSVKEIRELYLYVSGYAAGKGDERLAEAAEWLRKLSDEICGQGFIGCEGGERCNYDHK